MNLCFIDGLDKKGIKILDDQNQGAIFFMHEETTFI